MEYRIGSILGHGALTLAPAVQVPLFTLSPTSSTVVYQRILFGTSCEIMAVRHAFPCLLHRRFGRELITI